MERVSVSRSFDADPGAVRAAIADLPAFLHAAGFDNVTIDGDTVELDKEVDLFDAAFVLDVVEDPDATLAYEQREGIFEWMRTEYVVEATAVGTTVTAETRYEAVDLPVVGKVLDPDLVAQQWRGEIEQQFDWLASQVE